MVAAAGLAVAVSACGGSATPSGDSSPATSSSASPSPAASSTAAPSPTESSVTPSPSPTGALFVDVVESDLARFTDLIGLTLAEADLTAAMPLADDDVPLVAGATIEGAGFSVEQWQDTLEQEQVLGLDVKLGKNQLEKFGAGLPATWDFNSISTTDTSATLVATRDDGLRLEVASFAKPAKGEPVTEFRLVDSLSEMPMPKWITTLPTLEGGQVANIGEGVGAVSIDYFPAGAGIVSVRWRYDGDRVDEIADYLMSGAIEVAGFTLLDPDAIRIGATSFDVAAGDWQGQVVVGTAQFDGETLTDLVWLLQKGSES